MAALTITNAALNALRDLLIGNSVTPILITWVAVGTGTQGTPATATQLAAEAYRWPITNYANGGSVGEGIINALLAPTAAVGVVISEFGIFGGNASSAANSGTLFGYGLYAHTHNGSESIQFTSDVTF